MVVVMVMIAVLLLLGAGALMATRTQFTVDGIAEDILSTIRDAQNRAVSIMDGPGVGTTKVWGVRLYDNGGGSFQYRLVDFYSSGGTDLSGSLQTAKTLPGGATLEVKFRDGSGAVRSLNTDQAGVLGYVSYSTPFGKAYLTRDSLTNKTKPACLWTNAPATQYKDYFPDPTRCGEYYVSANFNSNIDMVITITYRGQSKNIIVHANGDAYIE